MTRVSYHLISVHLKFERRPKHKRFLYDSLMQCRPRRKSVKKELTFEIQHCTKFLQIYQTNHLNLTMKYTVFVANCCKH